MKSPGSTARNATATLTLEGGSGEWELIPPGIAADPEAPGRQIEDWIVGALDGEEIPYVPAVRAASADGPGASARRGAEGEAEARFEESLIVERTYGITLVNLTDRAILNESVITRVAGELSALLDAGDDRIVLDYLMVHRMSSRFLATVAAVHRRCTAAGGWLKVCSLRRDLAEVFAITGLGRQIPICPDAQAALAGERPELAARPLPVAALLSLAAPTDRARGEDGPPGDAVESYHLADASSPSARSRPLFGRPLPTPTLPLGDDPGFEDGRLMRREIVLDVLVITLLPSCLDDESILDPIRDDLDATLEQSSPRRVICLRFVTSLSSRAVGVLVAHAVRLARAGGVLRFCDVNGPIKSFLEGIDAPRVIATYPTLDEAVLAAWP